MSSLLDRLKDKALDKAKEKASKEELEKEVAKLLDRAEKKLPAADGDFGAVHMLGSQSIKKLRTHIGDISHLGEWGVTAFAAELAAGDKNAAQLVYLQKEAGWDDIFSAVDAAREADAEQERAAREAMAKFQEVMKDIGTTVARAALPFLLAAVGL